MSDEGRIHIFSGGAPVQGHAGMQGALVKAGEMIKRMQVQMERTELGAQKLALKLDQIATAYRLFCAAEYPTAALEEFHAAMEGALETNLEETGA